MSVTTLSPYPAPQFDAVSEASTDGDDNPLLLACNMVSKKKNLAKNKAKSSLCRNFAEKGYCPYGYKCQFAHGIEELRCNVDQNSYKTKPCNSFWKKNCCPYGFRCNFSHSIPPCDEDTQPVEPIKSNIFQYRDLIYTGRQKSGSRVLAGLK